MLATSGSTASLYKLLRRQLESFFPVLDLEFDNEVTPAIDAALEKIEVCFSHQTNKYFSQGGTPFFNFYHSDQYAMFLYYVSNAISRRHGDRSVSDRIYYLNKVMNSVDIYHEVELPPVFLLGHPVGTVLGRAKYSNFFTVSQNCTVGNNKGVYPRFGEYVTMFSGSKVLGDCAIGNNVLISANSYVKDTNIEDNSVVFGCSPNLVIKQIDRAFHDSVWK